MDLREFDKDYLKLCKKIIEEGVEVENRTGINTIKIPEYTFHFDLSKEFPILSTKQTFYRQAIIEMLWIWQVGSNDVRFLNERGVHIWDEWKIDEDGIYRIYDNNDNGYNPLKEVIVLDPLSTPVSNPNGELKPIINNKGEVLKAKSLIEGKNIVGAKYYGKEYANTIGTAYGYIVDRYNHTNNLIDSIRNNTNDRRMVKSLWQDEFLRTAVLPSCVWSTEWDVTDNKLNLIVHQRSCDVPLGLPFNVTQYATFLKMIAQVTNKEPGTILYTIKDAHIYKNQLEGIKKQLEREKIFYKFNSIGKEGLKIYVQQLETFLNKETNEKEKEKIREEMNVINYIINAEKPELELNPDIKEFNDFDHSKDIKDSKLVRYRHMGKINFPITQ